VKKGAQLPFLFLAPSPRHATLLSGDGHGTQLPER
jgi:hypothetical protein